MNYNPRDDVLFFVVALLLLLSRSKRGDPKVVGRGARALLCENWLLRRKGMLFLLFLVVSHGVVVYFSRIFLMARVSILSSPSYGVEGMFDEGELVLKGVVVDLCSWGSGDEGAHDLLVLFFGIRREILS